MRDDLRKNIDDLARISESMEATLGHVPGGMDQVETLREIGAKISEEYDINIVELSFAVCALSYEDQETGIRLCMEDLDNPNFELRPMMRPLIKSWLALLIGVMNHLKLKRLGALPQVSPDEEARIFEIAGMLKKKVVDEDILKPKE